MALIGTGASAASLADGGPLILIAALAPQQQGETPAATEYQQLVSQLVGAGNSLPPDTRARVFEAQFALIVDRSKLPCPDIKAALQQASGSLTLEAAKRGVNGIAASLRSCNPVRGTGGIGSLGVGSVPAPNFSGGSGSDYRP